MSLGNRQREFTKMTALIILYADARGYGLSYGDAWAKKGEGRKHSNDSFHYKRLAVDFNLFKDGKYLTETSDHLFLGEFWESIGGTWGGRFTRKDGNHYSFGET